MAAMQAENQQDNHKLRSVKSIQKRLSGDGNSAILNLKELRNLEFQEGTNRGSIKVFKYVNYDSTKMSQFRAEDISGHPTGEIKSPCEHNQNPPESSNKSESQDIPTHASHSFTSSQIRSDYSEEYIAKTSTSEYSSNKQTATDFSSKSATDFSTSKQLESFHPKQLHSESERINPSDEDNYTSKTEQRHGHTTQSSVSFSGQPRFLSAQSISQPTGPTPTLNQLLQASSPVHRFHNNYSSIGPETYQQSWSMQRPSIVPPVYSQPNQRPPQTGSPRLHHGPGGPSSPTPLPYQSYSQRFSSPARSHSPYSHHQLNTYTVTPGHSSNLYADQRSWNQSQSSNSPLPTSTNQSNPSSRSPQRSMSQSPAPPPSASPQPQNSNQSQNFHGMPQRSTTPNAQGIDSGELSGQNSNDSSNGPAGPATPNSQGMRPTPSPTGSTGSRSMSPAVGQQNIQMPPRPSSSQSDSGGPSRMSLSPLATQGPPPHMHNYKTNSSGQNSTPSGTSQNLNNINTIPGGMNYVNTGTNQALGYISQGNYSTARSHLQFPQSYQQGNNLQNLTNSQYQSNRSNNMAQYSQYPHKIGFSSLSAGTPPSPGSPQAYGVIGNNTSILVPPCNTIAGISNMGPPTSTMGPPPPTPNHLSNQHVGSSTTLMQINASSPSLNTESDPMPPPSTTPTSHSVISSVSNSHNTESNPSQDISSDSSITTHVGVSTATIVTTSNSTVTSIITTGPDGTSLDEGSQQSTLSNASAASGEESAFTPKVRKELLNYHNHPTTPQNTVSSPSAASINSVHEDYTDINSSGWPRTSASPVYNSHVSQDPYRSKKSDSLSKLFEMDDSIERRSWLDKLINFMEERRTPITSCPTISKNPLDLFRLYLCVKERGGFMEVCKVTKNKTWKDIAGLLGIGASSSAAYTLRKHYTKHLLAYECHFDRGGVDPQPIINQVEAGSKKKGSKGTSSVPSPGSSNSQDSFPAGGSNNTSADNYGSYQNTYSGSASSGSTADYNPSPPRPPSQSNTSPHTNIQQSNYQNPTPFQNYPQDQYTRPQGGAIAQSSEFNQSYSSRPHYTPYVTDIDRNYSGGNLPSNNAGSQEIYNRYSGNPQTGTYSSGGPAVTRSAYSTGSQGLPTSTAQQSVLSQQTTPQSQTTAGSAYSCPQDYYRQDQGTYGAPISNQIYVTTTNKNMPPPPPGPQQPRRHPDFVKEQYPTYNQQRSTYTGWSTNNNQYNNGNSIRMQYPNQQTQSTSQHQSQQQPQAVTTTPVPVTVNLSNSQQWSNQPNSRPSTQNNLNSLIHAPSPWEQRYNQTSLYPGPASHQSQLGMTPVINQQSITKREMSFPPDSIEAIAPLLYKRRKLTRADVAPVEAWRIMMALRSGLLAESCWALDILNILSFDDTSVHYFGLMHLPGLLDVLLEHFSRSLSDMFDSSIIDEDRYYFQHRIQDSDIDLGAVKKPVDSENRIKLLSSSNYTYLSRRGKPVKIIPRNDDIFILDNRRSWDYDDTETEIVPWQVDSKTINYIVTCFESGVNSVSFTSSLKGDALPKSQNEVEHLISEHDISCYDVTNVSSNLENQSDCDSFSIEHKDIMNVELKQQEKKKKIKTLSDVLSRIKKEPIENNDLTRELYEKKCDGVKKENEIEFRTRNNSSDHLESELLKNDNLCSKQDNDLNAFNKSTLSKFISDYEQTKGVTEESCENKTITEHLGTERLVIDDVENNEYVSIEEQEIPRLNIRDPAGTLKRRRMSDYEDESYSRDEASLYLVTETQDNLARRCVCLSTILRNLTFIPGNEIEFARNVTFLSLLGKLLLLHHEHPTRTQKTRNYDREEDADFADSCSSLQGENEWWWDFLYHIRENVLVMAANIAGHMDLSQYSEEISRPVLDGLIHWAVCPAAHGQDPFPTVNLNSSLSPQRLALEALCKLCVTESNVDLVVATPPFSRLQKLCSVLSRLLCRSEEQVLREFGVNLLHFLSAADSGVARTIALQTPCIALLVAFIEQAETSALGVANQHGIAALRDNPESMGTSLDMLRRAAGTLLNLSRHPDNRTLLLQHESRLLALVMSQILDQQVAAIVARVLFQCSRGTT